MTESALNFEGYLHILVSLQAILAKEQLDLVVEHLSYVPDSTEMLRRVLMEKRVQTKQGDSAVPPTI